MHATQPHVRALAPLGPPQRQVRATRPMAARTQAAACNRWQHSGSNGATLRPGTAPTHSGIRPSKTACCNGSRERLRSLTAAQSRRRRIMRAPTCCCHKRPHVRHLSLAVSLRPACVALTKCCIGQPRAARPTHFGCVATAHAQAAARAAGQVLGVWYVVRVRVRAMQASKACLRLCGCVQLQRRRSHSCRRARSPSG